MKHTLQHNLLGEIDYAGEEWTWSFYYDFEDNEILHVHNVVKMQAMKTGCYVLFQANGTIVNVPPGYKFLTEQKEGGHDGWGDSKSPVGQSTSGT